MAGLQAKELVMKGLARGILFSQDSVEFLESRPESDADRVLSESWPGLVVTRRDLAAFFRPKVELGIVRSIQTKPQPSHETQMRFYASKYEAMKRIISERLADRTFYSLDRVPQRAQDVCFIGIVRSIRQGGKCTIELEDPTATKNVIFDSAPDCTTDEVVCIQASVANGIIFGKRILLPDVPLRPPKKGQGKACFVSDLHLNEAPRSDFQKFIAWLEQQDGIDWLFVSGDIGDSKLFESLVWDRPVIVSPGHADSAEAYPQTPLKFTRKNIISVSNPAIINAGGVNVLLCHDFRLEMLKKRHLGEAAEALEEDALALDIVPDIVACGHDHKPFVSNYKSITIVNSGSLLSEFRPVIVDMGTREVQQASL